MGPLSSGRLQLGRRRFFRHRSLTFWAGTLVLATLTGVVVAGIVERADATRRALGEYQTVLVAADRLEAGVVVEASDVVERSVPVAFVPDHPLHDDPIGTVVRSPILAGETFANDRLADGGRSALASALPSGTAGVALPLDQPALPLSPGDRVDVWATADPFGAGGAQAVRAVGGALVIETTEGRVIIAVDRDEAGSIATALHTGRVELTLTGRP